jgi:hypothetical protein
MLCCYVALLMYFKSKGGYKAVSIAGGDAAPAGKPAA